MEDEDALVNHINVSRGMSRGDRTLHIQLSVKIVNYFAELLVLVHEMSVNSNSLLALQRGSEAAELTLECYE